jgi:hypothetical protein
MGIQFRARKIKLKELIRRQLAHRKVSDEFTECDMCGYLSHSI